MKNAAVLGCVVLVAVSAVLAGVVLRLQGEVAALRDSNTTLEEQLRRAHDVIEGAGEEKATLQGELKALREEAKDDGLEDVLDELVSPDDAGSAPGKSGGHAVAEATVAPERDAGNRGKEFMENLAKMMEKPEMREAMRTQQKMVLDMTYGALFKKLGLSPEVLGTLKDLLADRQMIGMDFVGKKDIADRAGQMKALQEETDAAIRELLGEEDYATYQDYQQTVGERMFLNQLNQQLSQKSMGLDEVQQEELVTLMVQEREALRIGTVQEQQQAWMDGPPATELIEKHLEQQEELNKRVSEASAKFLSVEQQKELETFQQSQLQMQRLGIEMMQGFMEGGEKAGEE